MKKYFAKSLLGSALLLSAFLIKTDPACAAAVHLSRHPGSDSEKIAASLNTDIIKDSEAHGEKPVIFTASVHLGAKKDPAALFVQVQSARLCGAAGCATSIYLLEKGKWVTVLDSINGEISVLSDRHKEMSDILVDKTNKWIWDGQRYVDSSGSDD